ncbi:MAG: hypothetical protein U0792_11210 [Gemmataceae bacterium]
MRLFSLALLVLGLSSLGCGKRDTSVPVSGTVTLDNVPVENGGIQFTLLDGSGPTAGAVIVNGKYTTTVPAGKVRVEIRASKVVGKRKETDTPDSRMVDELAEAIPAQYNTDSKLTADIAPGMGPLDFTLKTK